MRRKKITKIEKLALCPNCNIKVVCKGKPGQIVHVRCPNCQERGKVEIPKEKEIKKLKIKLHIPKKITLTRAILIISSFFITGTLTSFLFITATGRLFIDTLIVSIFVGIMIAREISDEYMSNRLKRKVNIFTGILTIAFLGVVVNEIIGFISQ